MKRIVWVKQGLAVVLILLLTLWGCPIYETLHVPCPACGTTRAWISFLKGDLERAFSYHWFFPLMPLFLFAVLLLDTLSSANRKRVQVALVIFAVILFLYNGMRLCNWIISPCDV